MGLSDIASAARHSETFIGRYMKGIFFIWDITAQYYWNLFKANISRIDGKNIYIYVNKGLIISEETVAHYVCRNYVSEMGQSSYIY